MICCTIAGLYDCSFFQAEDGIRDYKVTGVQTCALPIFCCAPMNTPGSQRRIIGAQQTVERWSDTATPSFLGSIVLQAGVMQGVQAYVNNAPVGDRKSVV